MKTIIILITKFITFLGNILNRGTTLPGKIALKLDKNILGKLKLPENIIVVTGSSGKGSTTKTITEVLRNLNCTVVYNDNGGNIINGICTHLIKNCTLSGKIKSDYIVLEADERYCKILFKYVTPKYLIITNVTRDQPPRQGHFDIVFNDIIKELSPKTKLVLNADDPYLQKLNGDITYYGINKNNFSYTEEKFSVLNYIYCPHCNTKLNYNYYHFENIGNYYCPNCEFKRPNPKIEITDIDYKNNTLTLNKEFKISTNTKILYSIYNILAAATLLNELGIKLENICTNISKLKQNKKLYEQITNNNQNYYILNNKCENATTFNQSLLFVDKQTEKMTIVIGWMEISRRYPYNDLSWLYDVEFEILKNKDIEKIICVGPQRYDLSVRIKNAGINKNKIVELENPIVACNYIKSEIKENVYAILNFDYVKPFVENLGGQND